VMANSKRILQQTALRLRRKMNHSKCRRLCNKATQILKYRVLLVRVFSMPQSAFFSDYPAETLTLYPGPLVQSPPSLTSSSVVEKTTKAAQSPRHSSRNHSHEKANMGNVLQGQRKNIKEISPPSREDSGSCMSPLSIMNRSPILT